MYVYDAPIDVQVYVSVFNVGGGAMNDRPALSKGELEVARTLWELKQATVREVYDAMSASSEMEFATVQTYLRRLEKKGYLRTKLQGRTRVYSPRVQPRTVIRETVDDIVSRLFAGDSMPLVEHLIEDRGLSGNDIARLRTLLDQLETKSSGRQKRGPS